MKKTHLKLPQWLRTLRTCDKMEVRSQKRTLIHYKIVDIKGTDATRAQAHF